MAILSRTSVFALLLIASCGDPLVDGAYRGEPLYSFRGRISDFRFEDSGGLDRYRASIFWSLTGETSTLTAELVEQKTLTVSNIFPPDVEIDVFNPPAGAGLERVTASYYVGMIYLYEDVDGDEEMDHGELRGGAADSALLYAKRELRAEFSPSRATIPAGYSLQEVPFPCEAIQRVQRASMEANCGVPLGYRCESDNECGPGGVCDDEMLLGQCMLPYDPNGCVPEQGAFYPELTFMNMTYPPEGWFLGCDDDGDCPKGQELGCRRFGFSDPDLNYIGACMPKNPGPALIDIFEDFSCVVAPVCFPFIDTSTTVMSFVCP